MSGRGAQNNNNTNAGERQENSPSVRGAGEGGSEWDDFKWQVAELKDTRRQGLGQVGSDYSPARQSSVIRADHRQPHQSSRSVTKRE